MLNTIQTRLQRFPGGSVTAREFSVALVQELDRVYDLEPVFYVDFDGFMKGVSGDSKTQQPSQQLTSPDFTLRVLKLLKKRCVFRFAIPEVSPLVELNENVIASCEAEARASQLTLLDSSDSETEHTFQAPEVQADRQRARHFEILQKKLTERWERAVTERWLETQPLYFNKGNPSEGVSSDEPPHLRGSETRLQYFSHIDILTFCVLDLFKCSCARGPGGSSVDWSPYELLTGNDAKSMLQRHTSSVETLSWQRLLLFLAECSPSASVTDAATEGARVFDPPFSSILRHRGSVTGVGLRPRGQHAGECRTVDVGHVVQMTTIKKQHVILSAAPRDGDGCEKLLFFDQSTHCTRSFSLPSRWGATLRLEPLSEVGAVAVAFVCGVFIIDLETSLPRAFLKEAETVTCIRYVEAKKALCVGNRLGVIRVYSGLNSLERASSQQSPVAEMPISSLPSLPFVEKAVHRDAVTSIHPSLLIGGCLVAASLDGRMSLWNIDTGFTRYLSGDTVVFGFDVSEELSLIFAFGVSQWPFVYAYDVANSPPIPLGGSTSSDKSRSHSGKIVSVSTLQNPRSAAASMDQGGGIRIWDLWNLSLLQSVDIPRECSNPHGLRWGSLGHFPGFVYDAEKGRICCFIRKYCVTLDYNFKDDLRSTKNASFQPIQQLFLCSPNRTVVTCTAQTLTVWSLATGSRLHSLSIPSLFQSLPPSAGVRLADGGDGGRASRLPGLDISNVQVIEESRIALVGLKGGGIVVVSLGNANVVCFVPPVAAFSGGDGLFAGDAIVRGEKQVLTTAQSIASTAAIGGDLRAILYIASCDTLFMSGAGRTYAEYRGRRKELLAKNGASIDTSVMLFHSFCDLVILVEEGELSIWTQHDVVLNPDAWVEVARSEAPLERITGITEVANTPRFLLYDTKGNVTLWDVVLNMAIPRRWCSNFAAQKVEVLGEVNALSAFDCDSTGFDPTFGGFYFWPGAYKHVMDQSSLYTHHPRFAPRFEETLSTSEFGVVANLWRLFRLVGLPKELHPFAKSALFDTHGHPSTEAESTRENVPAPVMSLTYLRRLSRKRKEINKHIAATFEQHVESSSMEPPTTDEIDSFFLPPTSCNGIVQVKMRQHWGHTSGVPNLSCEPGVTRSSKGKRGAKVTDATFPDFWHSLPHDDGTRFPLSAFPFSKVHSSQRARVEGSMMGVTCGCYEPRYRLFYCGDTVGRVTIYDLSFAVATPAELFPIWVRELRYQMKLRSNLSRSLSQVPKDGFVRAMSDAAGFFCPTFQAFANLQVTCLQSCLIGDGAAVTAVRFANDSLSPCVITADANGYVCCWSLFLRSICGVLSLGESSCLSPLRYPLVLAESFLSQRVLQCIEYEKWRQLDDESVEEMQTSYPSSPQEQISHSSALSLKLRLKGLGCEKDPLIVFPQQLFLQLVSSVKDASPTSGKYVLSNETNPPDPGWASQSGATIQDQNGRSYRMRTVPTGIYEMAKGSLNALTKSTFELMPRALIQDFEMHWLFANAPDESDEDIPEFSNRLASQTGAISGLVEMPSVSTNQGPQRLNRKSLARMEAKRPHVKFVMTKGGIKRFLADEEGRMGIYDDIPQPFNPLGSLEVFHQLPTRCLPLTFASKGRQHKIEGASLGVRDAPHLLTSSTQHLMSNLTTFSRLSTLRGKVDTPVCDVGDVVRYKEWYLHSVGRLETLGRQYNLPDISGSSGTGVGLSSPNQPQCRLSEALTLFHNMYRCGVGDTPPAEVSDLKLPLHSSGVASVRGETGIVGLRSSFGEGSLPPLRSVAISRRARESRAQETTFLLSLRGARHDETDSSDEDDVGPSQRIRQVASFSSTQLSKVSHNDFKQYLDHCTSVASAKTSSPPRANSQASLPTPKEKHQGFQGRKPLRKASKGGKL